MKREYPSQPILCVGGVVIRGQSTLLICRGVEPNKHEWTIPGGMVELGETVAAAVRREIREETGLWVRPLELVAAFERIVRKGGRVRFHYVALDYRCRAEGGTLRAASDAAGAQWVKRGDLANLRVRAAARNVIERAFAQARRESRAADRSGRRRRVN